MPPTPRGTRSGTGVITPSTTLDEAIKLVKTTAGVKDVSDAKKCLAKENWMTVGEPLTSEKIAKLLLAQSIQPGVPVAAANILTAVAFLMISGLQDETVHGVVSAVTEILQKSVDTLANDLAAKLESQIQAIDNATRTQSAIIVDMQKTQENMVETATQAATQVRSYSQIAATTPSPVPIPPPSVPISHSQIQIQNREQIKKRQVLIDFRDTEGLHLNILDEETLVRKATDALRTCYATAPTPKPTEVKLKAKTLLRNGGLLLELNSEESARWLRSEKVTEKFLEGLGSGANIRNRTYQVIVQFVPVRFDPTDNQNIKAFEEHNNITQGAIVKAEWIKPVKDRRENQRVATMRLFLKDAKSTNQILQQGAYVFDKRVELKRPHKEPIRCLRCQRFGHERRACKSERPTCGKCAEHHETDACKQPRESHRCANCDGPHPSFNRDCAAFWDKCQQMDQRCPENGLAFYPTDEPWTWVTLNHPNKVNLLPPPMDDCPRLQIRPILRQTRLTGSNSTPLGLLHPTDPQAPPHFPQ